MNEQIENNFTYHAPKPGQPEIYEELRAKAKDLAYLIVERCRQAKIHRESLERLPDCPMSHIPNAETEQALRDAQAGLGLTRHANVDAMLKDLLDEQPSD